MSLFKVTWINCRELDNTSIDFHKIVYDVSSHNIFYETCNGTRHNLRCGFGSIFDKLHNIVSLEEFQNEKPYEDGCDGDWYKFEYTLNGVEIKYEGYIYGLKYHEEVVSLIKSYAKDTLEDERKLLGHKCTDNGVENIIRQRQELEKDFLDFLGDISSTVQKIPDDFIKCDNCKSIIHNKYYKNRKYFGKDLVSDEFGDYEVEYDSGECPVCGQLNTELPCTTDIEPKSDGLIDNNVKEGITNPFDNNKIYSYNELDYLLESLSDEDRNKIKDCQFKLIEQYSDDDSGDVYDYITIFKDGNEIGKIDMQLHSNTYFDLIDMEIKTTDDIPYYTYEMTLYEEAENPFNDSKGCFGIQGIWNPFDDSKFRCKKCGKVFCTCNSFFTNKD